jgi:hypothetical protein
MLIEVATMILPKPGYKTMPFGIGSGQIPILKTIQGHLIRQQKLMLNLELLQLD